MGTTFTAAQRAQRETEVRAFLDDGWSLNRIAKHYGISLEAVRRFCLVRGWQSVRQARVFTEHERAVLDRRKVLRRKRFARKNRDSGLDIDSAGG